MLVTVGVLMLLFVAYEIWGTNLQEASSQRHLKQEFSAALGHRAAATTTTATAPPTTRGAVTVPRTTPPQVAPANLPLPNVGDPVARLQIPKIGVDKVVVQGVTLDQLKRGPGHYPETPLPGQKGNVGIAGHRTTYGAPFGNIDNVQIGDEMVVTTLQGVFRYKVDSKMIVLPSDVSVLADKGDSRLTLTSCHPKFSARQRIVISGALQGKPVARLKGQDRLESRVRSRLPSESEQLTRVRSAGGLDGAKASRWPALLWGGVCAVVWLAAWATSRLVRHRSTRLLTSWVPYLVGVPAFLVVLYVFFENFSRLLPSNF